MEYVNQGVTCSLEVLICPMLEFHIKVPTKRATTIAVARLLVTVASRLQKVRSRINWSLGPLQQQRGFVLAIKVGTLSLPATPMRSDFCPPLLALSLRRFLGGFVDSV